MSLSPSLSMSAAMTDSTVPLDAALLLLHVEIFVEFTLPGFSQIITLLFTSPLIISLSPSLSMSAAVIERTPEAASAILLSQAVIFKSFILVVFHKLTLMLQLKPAVPLPFVTLINTSIVLGEFTVNGSGTSIIFIVISGLFL